MHGPAAMKRRVAVTTLAILTLLGLLALAAGCCRSIDTPNTVSTGGVPVQAEAVQASAAMEATATSNTAVTGGATSSKAASGAKRSPWPTKVAAFAKNFSGPVWYPTSLPASMKPVSVDVIEFEPGSGPVCDIVFFDGKRPIQFVQGSPKTRAFSVTSAGKVAWGSEIADVVSEDPEDPAALRTIVISKGGNFAELSGEVDFKVLEAVAASMVAVK